MAKVLASTFVKYGPNAFLSLAAGIITMIKVDNEWLETIKELVKKYPELQKFYEIQQMVGEELKINDDLYFSYKEIFDKWLNKYEPKDKLARGRMELANLLHGFIKAKNYLRAGSDSGVVLFRSVVDWINRERDEYIPPQEAFREFDWTMQYLHGYTEKIGPVDDSTWRVCCGHVTWKYLREKYRPTRDLNIGGL